MRPPILGLFRPRRKFGSPRRGFGSLLAAVTLLTATGCSTTRPLQPLAPGETALGVSVGGPLLQTLGTVFPTPILSVGLARGFSPNRLTLGAPWAVTGGIDVTAALFGNLHVDPGLALYPLVRSAGVVPTVGVFFSGHVLANREDLLLAPHLAAVASWHLGRPWLLYTGIDAARPLKRQGRLLAGPLAGLEWSNGRTLFGLEAKWIAPNHDVEPAAPTWIAPFQHGFFAVLVSLGRRFGGAP